MSDSVRPQRRQPTRLPCPWDSPGKNTGVGCHFLLQCMKVKGKREVAQSCPTLSDPIDCSLPGSSIHGIFQARVLEWGAIAFPFLALRKSRRAVMESTDRLLWAAALQLPGSWCFNLIQLPHSATSLAHICPLFSGFLLFFCSAIGTFESVFPLSFRSLPEISKAPV